METATQAPTHPARTVRIPLDIVRRIEAEQRPRETYGDTLRRLLDERERRAEDRRE